MPRPQLIALTLLSLLAARPVLGHGGAYVRPPRLGPTTGIGAGATPGPGGPTTPVPLGGMTGTPTARRSDSIPAFSFMTWWQANGPALLHEFAPAEAGGDLTRPSPAVDADWQPIATLLREALLDADADIVDSALLAVGRSVHGEAAELALQHIAPLIDHPDDAVRRSAIIALGLLRQEGARPLLTNLLDPASPSDQVTHGIAAVALGLLANPSSIGELLRVLDRDAKPELHCGAILGLGLFDQDRERITAALLERLEVESLSLLARAQIPIALGRLGDAAAAAVPRLAALAQRGPPPLRAPAVIGLGRLASPDDRATLQLLRGIAERGSPGELRQLACISLGHIAARGTGLIGIDPRAVLDTRAFLLRALSAPGRNAPFAAIALALSWRDGGGDAPDRARTIAALRDALSARSSTAELMAAAAVALGLLGDQESADALRERLHPRESGELAGLTALALGLLRDAYAVGGLRTLLLSPAASSATRERAAWALRRIDQPLVTHLLVRELDTAVTLSESTFYARILGTVGDDSCVPGLIRRARNADLAPLDRAFSIVGLGRLLERTEVPWNARLSADANLLEACQVERALLDIY